MDYEKLVLDSLPPTSVIITGCVMGMNPLLVSTAMDGLIIRAYNTEKQISSTKIWDAIHTAKDLAEKVIVYIMVSDSEILEPMDKYESTKEYLTEILKNYMLKNPVHLQ